jgi:hypothetical protein
VNCDPMVAWAFAVLRPSAIYKAPGHWARKRGSERERKQNREQVRDFALSAIAWVIGQSEEEREACYRWLQGVDWSGRPSLEDVRLWWEQHPRSPAAPGE